MPRCPKYAVRCLIVLGTAVIAVFNWNCAKKGFPGGGPLDKTPPEVVSTIPASGDVAVPRTAEIQIDFSEPVERTTLLPNLFVSPPLKGIPEIKWSKRSARLRWDDTLRADVTYRVTIGVKLADQRKNLLEDSHTFAFSTGAQIDTGQIIGGIWTGLNAATGLEVFAYRLDSNDTWLPVADTAGGITPEFISQIGAAGGFDLPYLPLARFRVLAIGDRNRNHIPDPNEIIGIPSRDADLTTGSTPPPLRIFTQVYDTASFAIRSCSPAGDGSILIGLTHPADTAFWGGAPFVVLDSATEEPLPIEILRPVPPRFNVVPVSSAQFSANRSYVVRSVPGDRSQPAVRDTRGAALAESECVLTYPQLSDTTGARVMWTVLPDAANGLSPRSPVMIGFSEPIDTAGASQLLRVYDSVGTVIDGLIGWSDKRQLNFHPANAWPETTEVIVSLDSTLLRDRQGNLPPAQTWTWTFAPLTESQMGALSCRVQVSNPEWTSRLCRVEARPQGRDAVVRADVTPNELFEIPLPAGPWILSAYLDLDADGRFSPGTLLPYIAAEPRVVVADTISVRARFTHEDIEINF